MPIVIYFVMLKIQEIIEEIHNLPSSVTQYSLQRAQLSAFIFPFESTFVAHHHFPLPSLLQPLYFFPLYIKGNTQSWTTPSSLPNVLPLPWALQVICFPVIEIYFFLNSEGGTRENRSHINPLYFLIVLIIYLVENL